MRLTLFLFFSVLCLDILYCQINGSDSTRVQSDETGELIEEEFYYVENVLEHRLLNKIILLIQTNDKNRRLTRNSIHDKIKSYYSKSFKGIRINGLPKKFKAGGLIVIDPDQNLDEMRESIREALAKQLMNSMLYSLYESKGKGVMFRRGFPFIIIYAKGLSTPWQKNGELFTLGLRDFIKNQWTNEENDQLKALLSRFPRKDFKQLMKKNPSLIGDSFWNFISNTYGSTTISNLIYLTRINRSLDSGFLYVLGTTAPAIYRSWELHYRTLNNLNLPSRLEARQMSHDLGGKKLKKPLGK